MYAIKPALCVFFRPPPGEADVLLFSTGYFVCHMVIHVIGNVGEGVLSLVFRACACLRARCGLRSVKQSSSSAMVQIASAATGCADVGGEAKVFAGDILAW